MKNTHTVLAFDWSMRIQIFIAINLCHDLCIFLLVWLSYFFYATTTLKKKSLTNIDQNRQKATRFYHECTLIPYLFHIINWSNFSYSHLLPYLCFSPWLNNNDDGHMHFHFVYFSAYNLSFFIAQIYHVLLSESHLHCNHNLCVVFTNNLGKMNGWRHTT